MGSSDQKHGGSLLSVRGLTIVAGAGKARTELVSGVDLDVDDGEVVGIVGESGSGKSMTCRAVLGLLPSGVSVSDGDIVVDGHRSAGGDPDARRALRGRVIGLIPQDPLGSLNPVMRNGSQIIETIRRHRDVSRAEAHEIAVDLLKRVQFPDPERVMRQYPHELSGGMRQRLVSVIVLSARPRLLVADEPTTALDVTVQKEFVTLLKDLQQEYRFGMIFITHDLALVSNVASRIYVMKTGRIVESASVEAIFTHPEAPYTRMLLGAIRQIGV